MKTTIQNALVLRLNLKNFTNLTTKFGYGANKLNVRLNNALKEFDELIEDKRVELASVDEKGNLISTDKGYSFTKENAKKLADFIREESQKEIEIEPYIVEDYSVIAESLELLELFNGWLINVDIQSLLK